MTPPPPLPSLTHIIIIIHNRKQDTAEAGTIFGEDIEDVQADQYESHKDALKVLVSFLQAHIAGGHLAYAEQVLS